MWRLPGQHFLRYLWIKNWAPAKWSETKCQGQVRLANSLSSFCLRYKIILGWMWIIQLLQSNSGSQEMKEAMVESDLRKV